MKLKKTIGLVGLLFLLGMVQDATAELPLPGRYKGSLTVLRILFGRTEDEVAIETETVYQAVARIDADGYIRIVYSGDQPAIFGKLAENPDRIDVEIGSYTGVEWTARKLNFGIVGNGTTLTGPEGQTVRHAVHYLTKLTRVGK
jgi:hypothetical protein